VWKVVNKHIFAPISVTA